MSISYKFKSIVYCVVPNENQEDSEESFNSDNYDDVSYKLLSDYQKEEANKFLQIMFDVFKQVVGDDEGNNFRTYAKKINNYTISNGAFVFSLIVPKSLENDMDKDINSEICDGIFAIDSEEYEDEEGKCFILGISTTYNKF